MANSKVIVGSEIQNVVVSLVRGWVISIILLESIITANGQILGLKTGVYNSFYNFLNNRPVPAKVIVYYPTSDRSDPLYLNQPDTVLLSSEKQLYVSSSAVRIRWGVPVKRAHRVKRNMWGFYDGRHVYISSKNYTTSSIILYSRLLEYGRYSYFLGAEDIQKRTTGAIGGLIGTIPISSYFMLDMVSGTFYKVDSVTVSEVLQEYPNLHHQFQQEDRKNKDTLLKYIRAYNARYA